VRSCENALIETFRDFFLVLSGSIFYPQICGCFLRKRLFQHPPANALIENNLCVQRSISDEKTLVTIEDGF